MPNPQDINRLLRDFQNMIPQIAGAIVALVAVIGAIVGLVNPSGEGENPLSSSENSIVKPKTENLVSDELKRGGAVIVGKTVTVDGKKYPDSIAMYDAHGYEDTYVERPLTDTGFKRLTFSAGWDTTIPKLVRKEGTVQVIGNGAVLQEKTIRLGETANFDVELKGLRKVRIELPREDAQGMVIYNAVLHR